MNVFRRELDLSPPQLLQEVHTEVDDEDGTVTYVEQYFDSELPDAIRVQVYRLLSDDATDDAPADQGERYYTVHLVGTVLMGRGVLH